MTPTYPVSPLSHHSQRPSLPPLPRMCRPKPQRSLPAVTAVAKRERPLHTIADHQTRTGGTLAQVPVTIRIDRRLSDWTAYNAQDKGMWAAGVSQEAALGELWRVWGAELGLPAIAPEERGRIN